MNIEHLERAIGMFRTFNVQPVMLNVTQHNVTLRYVIKNQKRKEQSYEN